MSRLLRARGAAPSRALACACLCALLAACATAPPVPLRQDLRAEPAFEAAGRLSARHGNDAVTVHFTWRHGPAQDEFDLATPLGQTVARMRGDPTGVRVERPNEPPADYRDWSALTAAVLGIAVPMNGLASWIQGAPDARSASDIEPDTVGRPLVLRQQGWEIVYSYRDDAAAARPTRLVMRYPGSEPIEMRIVVDRWQPVAAS